MHQLIRPTTQIHIPDHEKSGIYKITCSTCQKAYVGQTSCNIKSRFRETIRYIKKTTHVQPMHCTYSIADTNMVISMIPWHFSNRTTKRPSYFHMNKMYIQSLHHNNELIPEQHPNEHNPMFELLQHKYHTLQPAWHLINNPTHPTSSFSTCAPDGHLLR
jgi:hypothetical protein